MSELWRRFRDLLPNDPLLVGTVQAHHADGTSTVVLPDGTTTLRVRGQGVAIGAQAFIKGGAIQGQAPSLPVVTIEI